MRVKNLRSARVFAFQREERFLLNANSPLPLYHQMEQIIFERLSGDGMVDRMLPSEADLGEIFGVSRVTVKKALENLTLKGYLDRRPGLGTTITRPRITENLAQLTSYTEEMQARGLAILTQILSVDTHVPDPFVQSQFGLQPDEQTLCIRRLRGTNEIFPVVLLQTEIPVRFRISPTEDFSGSFYRLLEEKYHIPIVGADEMISAEEASAEQARYLELHRGASVLVMERLTSTLNGAPVEFVRGVYRPDRYKFSIHLAR